MHFFTGFPDILNLNLICCHWLSVSGNSEIMHRGILTPYWYGRPSLTRLIGMGDLDQYIGLFLYKKRPMYWTMGDLPADWKTVNSVCRWLPIVRLTTSHGSHRTENTNHWFYHIKLVTQNKLRHVHRGQHMSSCNNTSVSITSLELHVCPVYHFLSKTSCYTLARQIASSNASWYDNDRTATFWHPVWYASLTDEKK